MLALAMSHICMTGKPRLQRRSAKRPRSFQRMWYVLTFIYLRTGALHIATFSYENKLCNRTIRRTSKATIAESNARSKSSPRGSSSRTRRTPPTHKPNKKTSKPGSTAQRTNTVSPNRASGSLKPKPRISKPPSPSCAPSLSRLSTRSTKPRAVWMSVNNRSRGAWSSRRTRWRRMGGISIRCYRRWQGRIGTGMWWARWGSMLR